MRLHGKKVEYELNLNRQTVHDSLTHDLKICKIWTKIIPTHIQKQKNNWRYLHLYHLSCIENYQDFFKWHNKMMNHKFLIMIQKQIFEVRTGTQKNHYFQKHKKWGNQLLLLISIFKIFSLALFAFRTESQSNRQPQSY